MSQHKLRFLPCYRKNCTGQLLTRDSELPFPIFFLVVLFEAQSAGRDDCVAGHVGLELRNVGKNYPFERSRRFPEIQPNSGPRDYSRLSCGGGETQLGISAGISAGFLARALGHRGASPTLQESQR